MNRPPLDALVLGHPILMVPATLFTLGLLVYCIFEPGWFPLALLLLFAIQPFIRFNKERAKYLAWKREWDSMAAPDDMGDWR